MKRGFVFAAAISALAACSSSGNGSCESNASGTVFCTEYTGANVSVDSVRTGCTAGSGTYSSSGCSTANRVGRCTYVASGLNAVSSFYSPTTEMQAQGVCTVLMGTWASN